MNTTELAEAASAPAEVRCNPQALWQRYHGQAGCWTENALIEQYLPLVRSVLGRLTMSLPDHVDRDDLNSAGLLGLLHALRNYNPASGSSFETYARLRVRGAMLDELRRMDWVPRTIHAKARMVQDAMARLDRQLGRAPTTAELASELELTPEQCEALLDEVRPATLICLDAVCSSDSGDASSMCDVVTIPTEDGPVEQTSRNELKGIILERLQQLPLNQRKVLALYYGEDLHLREIAEVMGLTESRICQIHSQAILSIRAYLQGLEATSADRLPSC